MDDLHEGRLEEAAVEQAEIPLTEQLEERYHELEDRVAEVRERLDAANDRAVHFIQENPGLAILGAVGVGYLIGRLASRRLLI
jgi:ElaB/YqjD/DUF883 family membrane-anchored ribosome-binding protein